MLRTLKMSNSSSGNGSPEPVQRRYRGMMRFMRMSCVELSLCSVSYHSIRRGGGELRLNANTSRDAQSVMSMDMTNVLPDLARPVNATSSRRGKQGSPNKEKRNSIGGSTRPEVMRFLLSINSSGLRLVSLPACEISAIIGSMLPEVIVVNCFHGLISGKIHQQHSSLRETRHRSGSVL